MIQITYFTKPATYFFNPKLQRQMLNLTALLITLFTGEVEGAKMRAWTELECEEEGRYKVIWLKKQFEAKLIKCKTRTCKTPIQSWNDSDSTFLPEWMRTRVLDLTVGIQSTDFLLVLKVLLLNMKRLTASNKTKVIILSLTSNILLHQSEIRQQVTTGNHKKP